MSIKKQKGESGFLEVLLVMAACWVVFFVFLDIQLSIRAERVPHDKKIVEAVKDSAEKTFTVTDESFVEPEDVVYDSND